MSIAHEITMLRRQVADREQDLAVAQNERTGRETDIQAEIDRLERVIEGLKPFAEQPEPLQPRMVPCVRCAGLIWPESPERKCDRCREAAAEAEPTSSEASKRPGESPGLRRSRRGKTDRGDP